MIIWKKLAIGLIAIILVMIPIVILTINENNKSIDRYPLNSYVVKGNQLIFDVYIPTSNEITGTYVIELPKSVIISGSDQLAINPRMKGVFDDDRKVQEIKNIFINGKIVWSAKNNTNPIETKFIKSTVEQTKLELIKNPSLDQSAQDFVITMKNNCKGISDNDKKVCNEKILLRSYEMSHEFVNKVIELTK